MTLQENLEHLGTALRGVWSYHTFRGDTKQEFYGWSSTIFVKGNSWDTAIADTFEGAVQNARDQYDRLLAEPSLKNE